MVIENFCGDRYLWDLCVLVQFRTAIKPMVISMFPPEMVERIREQKIWQCEEGTGNNIRTCGQHKETQTHW